MYELSEGKFAQLICEVPRERPYSQTYAVEKRIDRFDMEMSRGSPEAFGRAIKNHMARQLAEALVNESKLFHIPDVMHEGMIVRMQIAVNDRGAYENFIPTAERKGRDEGWKLAKAAEAALKPYGLEVDMYEAWGSE